MIENIPQLKENIQKLHNLLEDLSSKKSYSEKVAVLDQLPIVQDYMAHPGPIQTFLKVLAAESEFAIKAIVAIGQAPIVFNIKNLDEVYFKKLVTLLEELLEIEVFYQHIGGIIGYHKTMLSLILEHIAPERVKTTQEHYAHPEGISLEEDTPLVRQAVRLGIENFSNIAAIYPVGGSGDRLNLKDGKTGEALPAALLPFLGDTLLEGLINDLQAQEYLVFKLTGNQVTTPVVIMTSVEKNNHIHILEIFKKAHWFGRHPDHFHFFIQPLVPVITGDGNWSLAAHLTLALKPCGHGVLWKLAEESGAFNWLESAGRRQCYVRQINNPLAGIDQGLFALIGIGCSQKKSFGFLSCERFLNSDEGMNVLIEKKEKKGYSYSITNIEYTEFAQRGIQETPLHPKSKYSIYPANTNILFADIPSVKEVLKVCPIPGQIINMKSKVPFLDTNGQISYVSGGRLESTMQNIADYMTSQSTEKLKECEIQESLKTFILYNSRAKTISSTKKSYNPGQPSASTPEQAYYDLLLANCSLLRDCQFKIPPERAVEEYLQKGPSAIFLYHPGLGPLYSIIKQKIRQGCLHSGAELCLEIAEVDIENLNLEGSLLIQASSPLGFYKESILHYGKESRCSLKNVSVKNQGIDYSAQNTYWKNEITRKGVVKIILQEGAEFHAEDLELIGSHTFEVPPHCRLTLSPGAKGGWKVELIPLKKQTWEWHYSFDSKDRIKLTKSNSLDKKKR